VLAYGLRELDGPVKTVGLAALLVGPQRTCRILSGNGWLSGTLVAARASRQSVSSIVTERITPRSAADVDLLHGCREYNQLIVLARLGDHGSVSRTMTGDASMTTTATTTHESWKSRSGR
jgi:hypothetical protein